MIVDQQLTPAQRAAVEEAERFHGSSPGTVRMAGRHLAIEETQPQGESQRKPPPIEPQPAQETQEGQQAKEIEQAPQS